MLCQHGAAARRHALLALSARALLLLLLLAATSPPAGAAAREQTVFCNRTGPCRRCEARHMHAEACRETGYSEHLSCWPEKDAGTYEFEIKTHRHIDLDRLPLRLSRSCAADDAAPAPDDAAQWGTGASGAGWVPEVTAALAAAPKDGGGGGGGGGDDDDEGSGSRNGSSGSKQRPRHGRAAEYVSVGVVADSMGLIKFMAVMGAMLGGALPVVFWRKRQGAHRGYL